jgi:hypothetical protein
VQRTEAIGRDRTHEPPDERRSSPIPGYRVRSIRHAAFAWAVYGSNAFLPDSSSRKNAPLAVSSYLGSGKSKPPPVYTSWMNIAWASVHCSANHEVPASIRGRQSYGL